ncbi:MAG: hypothetical protein ACFFD4_15535 [Candidatus Odinarchaeota archaeon]
MIDDQINLEMKVKNLMRELRESDWRVREEAATALIRMGEQVIEYLLPALKKAYLEIEEEDSTSRTGYQRSPTEIPFSTVLRNMNRIYYWKITEVLVKIGEPVIVPIIKFLINETLPEVVIETCFRLLNRLSPSKEQLVPIEPLLTSVILTGKRSSLLSEAKNLLTILSSR